MSTRVKAHKVSVGMRVEITSEPGEWTVLSRHPTPGHWWLHRWIEIEKKSPVTGTTYTEDKHQTSHAHYSHMTQVIN